MKNLVIPVLLLCGGVLSGCLDLGDDDAREVHVIANSPSPAQTYVATSYDEMGGGAAGWCYVYVNVRRRDEQFNPDGGIIFTTACGVRPELSWQGEKRLSVAYPRSAAVYTQERAWGGVEALEVSYAPK